MKIHRILAALVLFAVVLAFGISHSYRLNAGTKFETILISNFADMILLPANSLAYSPVIQAIGDDSNLSAGNQLSMNCHRNSLNYIFGWFYCFQSKAMPQSSNLQN
jgi:hypothetical protein